MRTIFWIFLTALVVSITPGLTFATTIFSYAPDRLYQIYSAPLAITDIEFAAREHIISVAAGDTLRWQVSKTFSGTENKRYDHLLIKPTESGLTTTLVITTDQRTYHLLLNSRNKNYMPVVIWHYFDNNSALTQSIDLRHMVDIEHLNFNYRLKLIHGARPEWLPNLIFNDGNKTYIRLPIKIQEAPTLFLGDSLAYGQVINYRVVNNYYIVDRLFSVAILCSGINNQHVVKILYAPDQRK